MFGNFAMFSKGAQYWVFWGKKEKLPTDTGIRNTGRFGGKKKNYPPILV
jgi:hypothetical protein